MLDVGTFYFILSAFLLLLISSVLLRDSKNAQTVFWGVIFSSLAVLTFQILRFFFPEILSLGILQGKTGNLLGSWNSFGIFAGFSAVLSLLVIEFFPLAKVTKWILGLLVVFSLFVAAAVNLLLVWALLGVFALLVFIYKLSLSYGERQKQEGENKRTYFPLFSFGLVLISLLFFMSGQFIGGFLPEKLGLTSLEIGPSFSATMSVTKEILAESPIFGSGPNRFGDVWNKYKPESINTTIFWNTGFNGGSGLLPTFAATTGYLGILAWLVFFYFFISSGVKSLFESMKNKAGKEMAIFFMLSLFLFVASFFHYSGPTIILLAFAFAGAFLGLSSNHRENGEITFSFLDDPRKSFFSILVLVLLMLLSAAAGFRFLERFASIPYFQNTLSATEIASAETSILRAVNLHSNDLYLRTYAEVYLAKISELVAKGEDLTEEDRTTLQASFDEAVGGAELAVSYDPNNYLNYNTLGTVYGSVGSLGVEGAYDKALEAYIQASLLNPANPGIKLSLARVSFSSQNTEAARDYAKEAIALKPNYIEAFLVLSQIEQSAGKRTEAISYAEQALSLAPSNQELIDYVSSLRRAPATSVPVPDSVPASVDDSTTIDSIE